MRRLLLVISMLLLVIQSGIAAHRSSPDEALVFFEYCVETYDNLGREAALTLFNEPNGRFVKNDLYVFAFSSDGTYLASGANPHLVGTSFSDITDAAGNPVFTLIKQKLESDATIGELSTVKYEWLNRQTNQVENKNSFVQQMDDDVILGVGYYD